MSTTLLHFIILDLESAVEAGYTPSPTFEVLESVADYKSIIEPVVADLHRHTKPLCFRLMKDTSGCVQLHYRHKSGDKEWLPKDEDKPLVMLTVRLAIAKGDFV